MLVIWGRLSSMNVRKVVLAAQWLGLAFERRDAGMQHGIVGTPAYRALNPNAMVPTLEDKGFVLWESNAIVRYLFAQYGDGRYPQDLRERFDAERWMDWQQTTLNPAARDAFVQLVRTPPQRRDAAAVQASVQATEPLWDLLEAHLARRAFMAGALPGMADIPIACEAHRWRALPLPQHERPALARWWQALHDHPAAQGVLDITVT